MSSLHVLLYSASPRYPTLFYVFPAWSSVLSHSQISNCILYFPFLSHCTQPLLDIQLCSMSSLHVPLYSASPRYPTLFYVFPACPTVLSLSQIFNCVLCLPFMSHCTHPLLNIQLYSIFSLPVPLYSASLRYSTLFYVFPACPTLLRLSKISNCFLCPLCMSHCTQHSQISNCIICLPCMSHCTQPVLDIQLCSISSLHIQLFSAFSRYPTVLYVFPACPIVLSFSQISNYITCLL